MSDRIEALERLQRLRETGALSEAEFEREKAALFAPPPPAAEQDRIVVSTGPRGGGPPWLWPAVGAVVLLAVIAAVILLTRDRNPEPIAAETSPAAPVPQPEQANAAATAPQPAIRGRPQAEQLAAAFRAAFRGQPVRDAEDGEITYRPATLLWFGHRAVLISNGSNAEECHVCAGVVAIHHLLPDGNGFRTDGEWLRVATDDYGRPPEWRVTSELTGRPAMRVENGGGNQGIFCNFVTWYDLAGGRPSVLARVQSGYSNEGSGEEGAGIELTGRIANLRPGRSFDVVYTGYESFTERYRWRGDRFEKEGGETRVPQC
ncbi:MAG TPA: SHOCT domain-containing protein [Allosphingosinicella sp.]|jgi:hypothetical protein